MATFADRDRSPLCVPRVGIPPPSTASSLPFREIDAHYPAMRDEWVLITGASAGIGCELAKVFAARGYRLALVARDEARLAKLAQELGSRHRVQTRVLAKDLSLPGAAAELFAELEREKIPVSILVNNAGFGLKGDFAKGPLPTYAKMIELNVTALVQLSHLFLQPMLARGKGKILNLASTASFEPGPLMAIYYASKAFVFSFSYALADELAGTGVTVTALCPGPTRTEFQARAGTGRSRRIARFWMMEAGEVAKCGVEGLMAGKRVVIPGFLNKLGFILARISPTSLSAKVARKVVAG
jgi:short-subunit dehydrogenase